MEEPENPGSSSNGGIKEPLLGQEQDSSKPSAPTDEDFDSTGSFGFNHGSRPCRDIAFLLLFLLLTLASLALGIFSIARHNSDFRWTESPYYIRNQSRCLAVARSGPISRISATENALLSDRNRASEHTGKSSKNLPFSVKISGMTEKASGETLLDSSKNPGQEPLESKNRFSGVFSWLINGLRLGSTHSGPGFQVFSSFHLSSTSETLEISLISSLAVTLVISIPLILLLIQLLRRFAKELVFISLPLFVLLPAALNILWLVVCTRDSGCRESLTLSARIVFFVLVFVFCGVIAWIIFANIARVELTVRVISTAAEALFANLSLLLLIPGLSLLLLVFLVPGVFFIGYSYMNGEYVPNPEVVGDVEIQCGRGTGVDCCVWRTERWVPAYITLATITLLWTASLVAQVKVYVISGTIAQWYFADVGMHQPLSALKKSLGQAVTSSFGTLCFSSLIFVIVRLVRNAVDSVSERQGREGIALSFLRCCYDWILKAVEFLTKFTVDFAAITGDSFCVSARKTYDLLTNNLLSTVFVEVISTRLLASVMFVVSVIYAVAVWGVLRGVTNLDNRIFIITIAAWLLLLIMLSVFIAVMNIIVDTVYICYAMDKDKGVVSKPEAHDVYVLLPVSHHDRASLAVRQPDPQV